MHAAPASHTGGDDELLELLEEELVGGVGVRVGVGEGVPTILYPSGTPTSILCAKAKE